MRLDEDSHRNSLIPVKNEFFDFEEDTVEQPAKRQKRSRSNSQKLEESKDMSDRVKKQKSKKDKKKNLAQFFEEEADEDEDEEEELIIKKEGESYSEEFLKAKTSRLDKKMIQQMLDKYEEEENEEMMKDQKHEQSKLEDVVQEIAGEDEEEDISRNICLPSIKDSKLWRIKVIPGKERELVFKITNKLIEFLNNGDPLNVLDVFESQVCNGIIYCEAYKSQHVEKVIQGLSGVQKKDAVTMIPINEMTEVMKTCKIVQKQRFKVHQWVRVKQGIYKDDLGLIE